MEVREAVIDYLRDIAHLEPKSQVGYRQRLTVFAQWVYRLIMHTLSLLETQGCCTVGNSKQPGRRAASPPAGGPCLGDR